MRKKKRKQNYSRLKETKDYARSLCRYWILKNATKDIIQLGKFEYILNTRYSIRTKCLESENRGTVIM